jgi:hypothetical protein
MTKVKSLLIAATALCVAAIFIGCAGAGNTNVTVNTAANKTTANTTANTTAPANTAANTTSAANTTTASTGDSVGVPECDEYIKKYEECLTSIASKAPQAAPGLKTSFEAQRNAFKQAASTPQGKATLASTCTQAIATAKSSTAQWCPNW